MASESPVPPEAPVPPEPPVSLSLTFNKERETKNTFRYQEDLGPDESPAIGTLYIRKPAAAVLNHPETVKVTITPSSPLPVAKGENFIGNDLNP